MSDPIWTWEFNTAWRTTFMGRRWTDLMGETSVPLNGCVYWWACVFSTLFFPLFKFFKWADDRSAASAKRKRNETSKEQHSTLQDVINRIPNFGRIIGRSIHFVFVTKFSPFRIMGIRTVIAIGFLIDRGQRIDRWGKGWNERHPVAAERLKKFYTGTILLYVLGVLGFMVVHGIYLLIINWTVVSPYVAYAAVGVTGLAFGLLIGYILYKSNVVQITWKMMWSTKYRVCPEIVIESISIIHKVKDGKPF